MASVLKCSFCGVSKGATGLVQAGESVGSAQPIQICVSCARAAAEALQVEERMEEGRASERPRAQDPRLNLGVVCESTFEFEGETLQWSAQRSLDLAYLPVRVLEVRAIESGNSKTVEVDDEVVDALHAERVARGFGDERGVRPSAGSSPGQTTVEASAITGWTPLELDGVGYEWRSWSGLRPEVRRTLTVEVRDPRTGASGVMGIGPWLNPTVDDAVVVASAGLRSQNVGVETDRPG